jgi:hypothetical protein
MNATPQDNDNTDQNPQASDDSANPPDAGDSQ